MDYCFLLIYMMVLSCELFMPCRAGSELIEHSDNLSRALYFSNWTEMPKNYRAIMRIFMERTKRPMMWFIYKKFSMVHLGTFVSVS